MAKTPQIEGVKEAVRALRKIDPEMRKIFNANVKAVVEPMTSAMKSNYDDARFHPALNVNGALNLLVLKLGN